jgi:hypothetical protein
MFERQPLTPGQVLVTDKGFSGVDFEALVTAMGATLLRPDRRNEKPRFGNLGGMRQWVESIIDSLKGQLGLNAMAGAPSTACSPASPQRLAALGAAIWFNWQLHTPGRHITSYDH